MVVRHGEGAATIEGATLSKFMTTLDEYMRFYDKVSKRVRNERVGDLLPRMDLSKRADFEGDKKEKPKKIEKLEKELNKLVKPEQFKSVASRFDEEHNLWEVSFMNAQGAEYVINWEMASSPEYRQMMSKFKQIEQYMEPPFVIEWKGKGEAKSESEKEELSAEEADSLEKAEKKAPKSAPRRKHDEIVEKQTAKDLFEFVLNEGKKEYTVQRYKGLGEMSAGQLWETTMDPERRTLLSVKAEDIEACESIFSTLMGEDVEARRKFIEENALDVKNLDI
jgi:DNA gyrase subunit B